MKAITTAATQKSRDRIITIQLVFAYLVSWIVMFYDLPLPARLVCLVLLLLIAGQSYRAFTAVMLLVIFIPFYDNMLRQVGIGGLTVTRILFIPYFYYSIIRPKLREVPINRTMLLLILISIFTLKISYDILYSIQDVPIRSGKLEKEGLVNFLASYFDIFITLAFVYFSFTRLLINHLNKLFDLFLIIVLLEVLSILFMIVQNPAILILGKAGFAGYYENPFFGHKNDWGMMLALVLIFTLTRTMIQEKNNNLFRIVIVLCAVGVLVSLSRQAIVWSAIGVLLLAVGARNTKILLGFATILVVIFIIRPPFLMDRMDSMLTARSSADFESLNRKVSERAQEQAIQNLQMVPRMFESEYEYNWSEGFWNGMLHQQGIIGLVFHTYLYIFLFLRYYSFQVVATDRKLKLFTKMAMILVVLMFFANFTRREAHFLHYNGIVTQINSFNYLVFMYVELAIYAFKHRLKEYIAL